MKKFVKLNLAFSILITLFSCGEEELKPTVDFIVDQPTILMGDEIAFTDLSKNNPTSWFWNFGDDTTSTLQNPTHIYKFAGNYSVYLLVENETGADYITKDEYITVTQETGTLTDSRDNKTYKTIKIGDQWWMAENLNYNLDGSTAYQLEEENAEIYGRLYHHSTAQLACPEGWHIPSKNEFEILLNYMGKDPGSKMKAISNLWVIPAHTNAINNNLSRFNALPGGYYDGLFQSKGEYAYFMTSTIDNTTNRPIHFKLINWNNKALLEDYGEEYYFSVRCIKD